MGAAQLISRCCRVPAVYFPAIAIQLSHCQAIDRAVFRTLVSCEMLKEYQQQHVIATRGMSMYILFGFAVDNA